VYTDFHVSSFVLSDVNQNGFHRQILIRICNIKGELQGGTQNVIPFCHPIKIVTL
jgi:hypothetical protein